MPTYPELFPRFPRVLARYGCRGPGSSRQRRIFPGSRERPFTPRIQGPSNSDGSGVWLPQPRSGRPRAPGSVAVLRRAPSLANPPLPRGRRSRSRFLLSVRGPEWPQPSADWLQPRLPKPVLPFALAITLESGPPHRARRPFRFCLLVAYYGGYHAPTGATSRGLASWTRRGGGELAAEVSETEPRTFFRKPTSL